MVKILSGSRHGGRATRTPLIKEIIEEEYKDPEYIVATDHKDDYNYEEKTYRIPSFRATNSSFYRPYKALKNLIKSRNILKKEKPDITICYGANTSIFLGIQALRKQKQVIAVESENRTQIPSKSPKILNKFGAEVWTSYTKIINKYPQPEKAQNKKIIQRRTYDQYKSKEKQGTLVIPSSSDKEIMKNH